VTVAAINGVATVTGLTRNRPGTGYRLVATGTALAPAMTSSFEIRPLPTIVPVQVLTAGKAEHSHRIGFQLDFNAPLDGSRAQDANNYTVIQAVIRRVQHRRTTVAQPVGLRAVYDPPAHAVRLILLGKPRFARGGQIAVNASPPAGLTNSSGDHLDGCGAGHPGTAGVFKIPPRAISVVR
jgi:hypothetical protein